MPNKKPFVSIVIPCRNEEKYIGKCLDSIIANDFPKDKLEILVVDGYSKDKTREILKGYSQKHSFIKFLDNPKKFTPFALNIGIKESRGDYICITGAHSKLSSDFIAQNVKALEKYKADCVGGRVRTATLKKGIISRAINKMYYSPFGVGDARYRQESKNREYRDTVPRPCYKREIFEKIGFFNEQLTRSQDMEFNLRLKRASGKILFVPEILAYYYPKSNLKDFFFHNFKDGVWAIYPLKFVKTPFRFRHYVPLIFVSSLLGTGLLGIFFPISFRLFLFVIGLYFFVNLYFSAKITMKEKDLRYIFALPIVFATRHFGYGLGSVWGLIKLPLPIEK
jgi:glycosyltransferase involved in cell wall biosynthesis